MLAVSDMIQKYSMQDQHYLITIKNGKSNYYYLFIIVVPDLNEELDSLCDDFKTVPDAYLLRLSLFVQCLTCKCKDKLLKYQSSIIICCACSASPTHADLQS